MDPFTVATGSLQLAKLAGSLALSLQAGWNRYTEAEEHIDGIVALLESLKVTANRLSDPSRTRLEPDLKPALDGCLKACATLVRDMDQRLKSIQSSDGTIGVAGSLRFVWSEAELVRLEERLGRQINALNHILLIVLSSSRRLPFGKKPKIHTSRPDAVPVLRQAREDASQYARDEDFETLSQAGTETTSTSGSTLINRGSRIATSTDHRSWIKSGSAPSNSSVLSLLRKPSHAQITERQVESAFATANIDVIRQWLDAGNRPNAQLYAPETSPVMKSGEEQSNDLPLCLAISAWREDNRSVNDRILKLLDLLLDYGADINRTAKGSKASAFHTAVHLDGNGSGQLIKYFLDHGANVHATAAQDKKFDAKMQSTAAGASVGSAELVQLTGSWFGPPQSTSREQPSTSRGLVSSRRNLGLVPAAYRVGSYSAGQRLMSALFQFQAIEARHRKDERHARSHRQITSREQHMGIEPDYTAPKTPIELPSILHEACDEGLPTAVLLLIGNGANVRLEDSQGDTPLHLLACCKKPKPTEIGFHAWDALIKEFIKKGADVNAANQWRATALSYAVAPHPNRSLDMVKALTTNGANFHHRDDRGRTLFHILVNEHDSYYTTNDRKTLVEIYRYLLKLGLNSQQTDFNGKLPNLDGL